jgi:hypothetical protein
VASDYYLYIRSDSGDICCDCSEYIFAFKNFRSIIHDTMDNRLGSNSLGTVERMSFSCNVVAAVNSDHYISYLFHSHYTSGHWITNLIVSELILSIASSILIIIILIILIILLHRCPIIIVIIIITR